MKTVLTRREVLAVGAAAALPRPAVSAPAATVAIARCRTYSDSLESKMARIFDQIGGIGSLVKGKTVAVKLNLTGNPARFPERADLPYRNNPDTVLALVHLLARAGARRVRLIESFFPARQDPDLWARYGLDIQAINNAGCKVEWENVQNKGQAAKYVRIPVPGGGYVFPAYHLNHSFVDCDVYASLSKLKNHWIAGVTMALKNNFGNTPCSLYGGDAGTDGNENPQQERGPVCHSGTKTPPKGVDQELHPDSPRDPGYRVPRVTADLVAVRPIDLSIVDGVASIRGGEGAWNPGVQIIKPGLLLCGKNPVCVDAVSMAVMGYDPRAERGTKPFVRGDNTLKLAEAKGIGTTDLARIEVAGLSIKEALHDYGPGPVGKPV
ncbi:MAG: DUF362 domain-containing protein [Bryobacteraceae bacterium]|nr:DUF362 domain-containing protein [Bryobacterales bacterium]NUN03897.1 DUF362 domain-containing protein [Bryobacteraceae bacterium]